MTYFKDLTQYSYFKEEDLTLLNVGWLDSFQEFLVGNVPPNFLNKIKKLAKSPTNLCRGWHSCQFCVSDQTHGNGEIRITRNGITYVAPVLICHYVEVHNYLPPQEFIDAVMKR